MAEIGGMEVKPKVAMACPPTSEPSAMPRKSAELFQASTAELRAGNRLSSNDCCAGKNLRQQRGHSECGQTRTSC